MDHDNTRDRGLRPECLEEFQGQEAIRRHLSISMSAARKRGETAPHQLLAGPPGLGKTTLANIIAWEMKAALHTTSGPALEKPGDLAGTLIALKEGDVLFIDEIHRLPPTVEEFLYPAMEDQKLDILVEGNNGPKTVRMNLEPFTLVGATTRPGNISGPLRSRFQTIHKLANYTLEEITRIVIQSGRRLELNVLEDAATEIAKRARGTPRTANNHLLWARDYASAMENTTTISLDIAREALKEIGVDDFGMDATDRKILQKLVVDFKGGPVGIQSLAVACGEDPSGVEEIHEPYLIEEGYIRRSAAGRIATEKAVFLITGERTLQHALL